MEEIVDFNDKFVFFNGVDLRYCEIDISMLKKYEKRGVYMIVYIRTRIITRNRYFVTLGQL